jgi:hypothetical protein
MRPDSVCRHLKIAGRELFVSGWARSEVGAPSDETSGSSNAVLSHSPFSDWAPGFASDARSASPEGVLYSFIRWNRSVFYAIVAIRA